MNWLSSRWTDMKTAELVQTNSPDSSSIFQTVVMKRSHFKFAPISSEISQKVYTVLSEPDLQTTPKPTPDVEQSEESLVTSRELRHRWGDTFHVCMPTCKTAIKATNICQPPRTSVYFSSSSMCKQLLDDMFFPKRWYEWTFAHLTFAHYLI